MSDAIVLDVLSASPVQLDVGDADPIAREEIEALAGRVTTVEGDVSGLSTRMGAVEGDISALGTTVDGIDARVEAIEADYVTSEDVMGALGGEAPSLVAGSSTGILGDPETASWMQRTTAADGAALIESVKGNTLRWNQLVVPRTGGSTVNGITTTATVYGTITLNGTSEAAANIVNWSVSNTQGHKYLIKSNTSDAAKAYIGSQSYGADTTGNGIIITNNSASPTWYYVLTIPAGGLTYDNVKVRPCIFDLTAMFGAGNEPATVAEFEALFPLSYYPYDVGSLLSVRMEGVETVGFNQWDEAWEQGTIDRSTGENNTSTTICRSKNFTAMFPDTDYYFTIPSGHTLGFRFYDAAKSYIGYTSGNSLSSISASRIVRTPVGCHYLRFVDTSTVTMPVGDICINISDPARNSTYEPYWRSERAIPASTYFPDGLRSAGSVADELRADAAVTRVGAVDLGTLTWNRNERPVGSGSYRFESSAYTTGLSGTISNIECAAYDVHVANGPVGDNSTNKAICGYANAMFVRDDSYTDAATFKAAMSGVMLYYELATPTTTPIDPPLSLSYRVGAGGTERVMVASGTQSAPPIFATRYPLDPADLAASIAPRESATSEANHAVGDLVMLGWTLCKVTTAIARGESITIGTNVTRTSVAAEIAALS